MLLSMRKTYDAAFKAKVAFEGAKGEKTIAQIASEFSVHPNQIRLWRKHLMEQLPELFSSRQPLRKRPSESRLGRPSQVVNGRGKLILCGR